MPPRPLTDQDKEAMRDLMRDLAGRLFQPDAGVTLTGQPVRDFLAGPTPSSPLGAIQQSMGRSACESWARGDGSGIPPRREAIMRDTCSPYIDSIGTPPPGSTYAPPFKGGQCAGTTYGISWTASCVDSLDGAYIRTGNGSRSGSGTTFAGPISSITPFPDSFGTTGLPQSWQARVVSGPTGTVTNLPIVFSDVPSVSGRTERAIRSFSPTAFRVGGGSDVCGDPDDEWSAGGPGEGFPAPAPIPSPPGFDIPFPGVDVTLNPDGTINIDFGDGGPPLTIDPGGDGPGSGGSPAGPPEAGASGSTGEGGDDEGEAPEGKELWALRIDIDSVPSGVRPYAPGVYRGVCYVYMGDNNGLDHDPAGAMLRDGQLVLAERDGLTKYRVSANVGYSLTVTPFWRTPEEK